MGRRLPAHPLIELKLGWGSLRWCLERWGFLGSSVPPVSRIQGSLAGTPRLISQGPGTRPNASFRPRRHSSISVNCTALWLLAHQSS